MKNSNAVLIDRHPGRSTQTIGLAHELGTEPDLIHEPSVGVVGTKGDSQCYLGVLAKVEAIHARLKSRIGKAPGQLKLRLVQPEYTIATSDGIATARARCATRLVVGHVGPEAAVGGPIAFVEDGDEIVIDLNANELSCTALRDPAVRDKRRVAWEKVVADNGGVHPDCGKADTRLLHRARHTAVPATRGGGLHPNREVWVREPREAQRSGFVPRNRHRPDATKAF